MKLEKIFICDHGGKNIAQEILLGRFVKQKRIKLEINWATEKSVRKIPEGYDIYVLHLEDVDSSYEISKLKKEQPWSFILGYSGALDYDSIYTIKTDFEIKKESCDRVVWALDLTEEIKQVLEKRKR